ncbi:hypothetical protein P7C70_g755, partial [Phenoliferia sp. Uapishka_3]
PPPVIRNFAVCIDSSIVAATDAHFDNGTLGICATCGFDFKGVEIVRDYPYLKSHCLILRKAEMAGAQDEKLGGCVASCVIIASAKIGDPAAVHQLNSSLMWVATWADISRLDLTINFNARIWLSCSAGSDLTIAISLVVILWRAKRSVAGLSSRSQVNGPLAVLIRSAIEGGGVPAFVTILSLAMYRWNNNTNVALGLMLTVGRVYSHTLFFTLLVRQKTTRASMSSGTCRRMNSYSIDPAQSWGTRRPSNAGDMHRSLPGSESLSVVVHALPSKHTPPPSEPKMEVNPFTLAQQLPHPSPYMDMSAFEGSRSVQFEGAGSSTEKIPMGRTGIQFGAGESTEKVGMGSTSEAD